MSKTKSTKKPKSQLIEVEASHLSAAVITQIDTINNHWKAGEFHHQQMCGHLIMAGHQLLDLKKRTLHGQWEPLFKGSKSKLKFRFPFTVQWGRKLMQMAEMSKKKLSALNSLPFDKPFSEWSEQQLETLRNTVIKRGDGQTFQQLSLEWGIAKAPQGSAATGGDLRKTSEEEGEKEEPTMRHLAFALFADPVHNLGNLRTHVDYEKALYALPVISSTPEEVSLSTMEQEAESFLADIRKAKQARMQELQTA